MEIFPVGGGKQPHFIDVVFSWFPGFGQVRLGGPVLKGDIWHWGGNFEMFEMGRYILFYLLYCKQGKHCIR